MIHRRLWNVGHGDSHHMEYSELGFLSCTATQLTFTIMKPCHRRGRVCTQLLSTHSTTASTGRQAQCPRPAHCLLHATLWYSSIQQSAVEQLVRRCPFQGAHHWEQFPRPQGKVSCCEHQTPLQAEGLPHEELGERFKADVKPWVQLKALKESAKNIQFWGQCLSNLAF